MSLFIASLASGSNGNCYYIGNKEEAVLIDAGISCREIEKRMLRLGLNIKNVKGVFITHEHADHICGLVALAKKFQFSIYSTSGTLRKCGAGINPDLIHSLSFTHSAMIGRLTVSVFPKSHDAMDPCGFVVTNTEIKVGVFTDIGKPCADVIRNFAQCQAAFLEANYDETLLDKGKYPYHLKKRIKSDYGHLSNYQALQLFKSHRSANLSHLFLSHLSKNNNCPELVKDLFNSHAGNTKIILASRYKETAVYEIESELSQPMITNYRNHTVLQLQFSFD